jgi:hypothetical protein
MKEATMKKTNFIIGVKLVHFKYISGVKNSRSPENTRAGGAENAEKAIFIMQSVEIRVTQCEKQTLSIFPQTDRSRQKVWSLLLHPILENVKEE